MWTNIIWFHIVWNIKIWIILVQSGMPHWALWLTHFSGFLSDSPQFVDDIFMFHHEGDFVCRNHSDQAVDPITQSRGAVVAKVILVQRTSRIKLNRKKKKKLNIKMNGLARTDRLRSSLGPKSVVAFWAASASNRVGLPPIRAMSAK